MDAAALGDTLAGVNAIMNGTATVCLVLGYLFIRRGRRDLHARAMIGAVSASALFLVFYVTRFMLTGTHEFAGEGMARTAYLTILFSHMVLAVVIVPLILRLLFLAAKERFDEHRRLARWTYPMWMYVSVTGIVVYLMLYQIYGWV
jgi:putative membrane protein